MMFQPLDTPMPRQLPYTVEQVVDVLYDDLSLRHKVIIANLSESELEMSCLALAKTIRKEFALYSGNKELLDSCCRYLGKNYDYHEDPAMVIIKELWRKAKRSHLLHVVHPPVHSESH